MARKNNVNMTDQSSKRLLVGTTGNKGGQKTATSHVHDSYEGVSHGGTNGSFLAPGITPTPATATATGIPFATKQDYLNSLGYVPQKATPSSFMNMKYGNGTSSSLSRSYSKAQDELPYQYGNAGASGFAPSQSYLQAMSQTQQMLDKLSSGRTSYTDKINRLMAQIEGRDPFSYDANTDPMFQSYLQMMMGSGQQAMQDTMGQASALTGGYGSTYATSAGSQAYNGMIQDAYNNMPDYYNAALSAYEAEGNRLANQLGMYQTADDMEYNRLASAYSAQAQNAARLYDQEFNAHQQAVAEDQWQKQYLYNLAKANGGSQTSGSSGEGESGKAISDTLAKQIQSAAASMKTEDGDYSDQFYKLMESWVKAGYDENQIWGIVDSYTPDYKAPVLNAKTGMYVDGSKPVYTKEKGGKYKDVATGKEYSKEDLITIYGKSEWKKYIN